VNGLSHLLDRIIVEESLKMKTMNNNGCARMQLNVLVLQQNIKNVEPNALLTRSARFFDYFIAGPDAVISHVEQVHGKDVGFSYEELKKLLELYYAQDLQSSRREVSMQAQSNLDAHVERLLQLMSAQEPE
jgi:exocyst complex component 4